MIDSIQTTAAKNAGKTPSKCPNHFMFNTWNITAIFDHNRYIFQTAKPFFLATITSRFEVKLVHALSVSVAKYYASPDWLINENNALQQPMELRFIRNPYFHFRCSDSSVIEALLFNRRDKKLLAL